MSLDVVLRYRTRRPWAPGPATLRRWARLAAGDRKGELGIRVVGQREGRQLNERWRGRGMRDERPVVPGGAGAPRPADRRHRDLRAGRRARGARAGQGARRALGPHDRARHAAPARLRPLAREGCEAHGRPRAQRCSRASASRIRTRMRDRTQMAAKGKGAGWLRRLTKEGPRDRAGTGGRDPRRRARRASSTPTRCR